MGALLRLGTAQFRHDEEIMSIAYSPDGKRLASAGVSGEIRVWDVADGKLLVKLPAGSGETVLFTPDSKGLICDGTTEGLALRDASTGHVVRNFGKRTRPSRRFNTAFSNNCIALSPDGTILVEPGQDEIILWQVADGKRLHALSDVPRAICALAFSPDGKTLAGGTHMGDYDNPVYLWDVATGRLLRQTQTKSLRWVHAIAFSHDGKSFAAADNDDRTIICDVATSQQLALVNSPARSIACSANGAFLAIGSTYSGMGHGYIHIVDAASKNVVRVLRGHVPSVTCVAFAPTGKTFASAGPEGTIRFWDTSSGKENVIPRGHVSPIDGVVFSADGKRVATLSGIDHTLLIWDAVTGTEISRITLQCGRDDHFAYGHGRRLIFGPDGNRIACDESVYDIETGRAVLTGQGGNMIAVSSDGSLQATTPKGRRFFDRCVDVSVTATGKKIVSLSLPDERVVMNGASAFSPDGRLLAVASSYHSCKGQDPPRDSVHLFDIPSGKLLREFMPRNLGPSTLVFTPDGELLVTDSWQRTELIHVWRVADGRHLCEVSSPDDGESERHHCPIAVSADNNYLAFSDKNSSIFIWEIATRQEVHRLHGPQRELAALAFSPNGTKLVSAGVDMRPIVWDLAPQMKGVKPTTEELKLGWSQLAGQDARAAYRAGWTFARNPELALPLLRDDLKPLPVPDLAALPRLIADLDADTYEVRQSAFTALSAFRPFADDALLKALAKPLSLEFKRRVTMLLTESHDRTISPAERTQCRAIQILERINSPDAIQLLKALAMGAPQLHPTRDADRALRRLDPTAALENRPVDQGGRR